VNPSIVIMYNHVITSTNTEELVTISGLPTAALNEVGNYHRQADPEPLEAMLKACERQQEP
jgi:hypothetical protein